MKAKVLTAVFLMLFAANAAYAMKVGAISGIVIDGTDEKPVKGASVVIYWTKRIRFLTASDNRTMDARLVTTDESGKFEIPSANLDLGLSGSLDSTVFVVYVPGFEMFSLRSYNFGEKQVDVAKEAKIIRLKRVGPGFNHAEHYRKIDNALDGLRDLYISERKGEARKISERLESYKNEILRRAEWENIRR